MKWSWRGWERIVHLTDATYFVEKIIVLETHDVGVFGLGLGGLFQPIEEHCDQLGVPATSIRDILTSDMSIRAQEC